MKSNKKIFLIISAFALIAVTSYGTQASDDGKLMGLTLDQGDGAGGNNVELNNIDLFIDDRLLLQASQLFLGLAHREDSDDNAGRKRQAGNLAINFGQDAPHASFFKFSFSISYKNINDGIGSAENKAISPIDIGVFSVDNSGPFWDEGDVEGHLLFDRLLTLEESKDNVNLFWKLLPNKDIRFVRASHR